MPRLPPSLLRRAHRISPHAAALLPACRDLPSALNELRWIREHVLGAGGAPSSPRPRREQGRRADGREVARLCRLRGRGVPLQYVLGSQPFGPLDLRCRPGVLIPRPEPEAYAAHLAGLLLRGGGGGGGGGGAGGGLGVLDLCTGTGCIALLLHALLAPAFPSLRVRGVDVAPRAVALARENARRNVAAGRMPPPAPGRQALGFDLGDVFSDALLASLLRGPAGGGGGGWDVVTCNPPYISREGFARGTARSVRNHEPRLAQVPGPAAGRYRGACAPEDVFYARLLDVGAALAPRVMLMEVGDLGQALRVVGMALRHATAGRGLSVEIWRDWPDVAPEEGEETAVAVGGEAVQIKGSGHGRSVLLRYE